MGLRGKSEADENDTEPWRPDDCEDNEGDQEGAGMWWLNQLRDLLKLWLQIPSKPPLGQIPACAHCECRRVFVIMRTSARDALESICVDYHTFPPAAL